MKKALITMILISTISLVACDKVSDIKLNNTEKDNEYIVTDFKPDNKTIKNEYEWTFKEERQKEDNLDEDTASTEENVKVDTSEIKLVNTDESTDFTIENEDVIYKDTRFKGLNTAIDSIEIPYDKNTFINFIVKTFNTDSAEIAVTLNIEDYTQEAELSEGEGQYFSLHENLLGESSEYKAIFDKYNEKVAWMMMLIDNETDTTGVLYGNKYYLIYRGIGEINLDMNEFNSDIDTETTETTENII